MMALKSSKPNLISLLMLGSILFSQIGIVPLALAQRISPQMQTDPGAAENDDPSAVSPEFTKADDLAPVFPAHVTDTEHPSPDLTAVPGSPDASPMVLKARVNVDKDFVPDVVFGDSHTVEKGQKLTLILMDSMANGFNEPGDEFNARLKFPIEQNGQVLVPRGALVKGHVAESNDPGKAFSKSGKLVLAFDYILMPDGRKIPFKSDYTKGDTGAKVLGRAVGGGVVGTVGGAAEGVLIGLRFGGALAALVTHGATLAVGSGLGAAMGLGAGLSHAGSGVMLNEGDEIQVAMKEPIQLPAMAIIPDKQNEIQAPGLTVKVLNYTLGRDPFRVENQITLKLKIDNQTQYTFGSLDIGLVDEYNTIYPLSPFGDQSVFYVQLAPQKQLAGDFTFSVKSPDLRHYLVFYKPYTRDVIAKISLSEAIKALSQTPEAHSSRRSRHQLSALQDPM